MTVLFARTYICGQGPGLARGWHQSHYKPPLPPQDRTPPSSLLWWSLHLPRCPSRPSHPAFLLSLNTPNTFVPQGLCTALLPSWDPSPKAPPPCLFPSPLPPRLTWLIGAGPLRFSPETPPNPLSPLTLTPASPTSVRPPTHPGPSLLTKFRTQHPNSTCLLKTPFSLHGYGLFGATQWLLSGG